MYCKILSVASPIDRPVKCTCFSCPLLARIARFALLILPHAQRVLPAQEEDGSACRQEQDAGNDRDQGVGPSQEKAARSGVNEGRGFVPEEFEVHPLLLRRHRSRSSWDGPADLAVAP
jgi:hypothetical protein